MARIRSIKPDFFKHYDLYQVELEHGLPLRVAFAGLWCCADREGRFKWHPMSLKTDVLPYDQVDFTAVLNALQVSGFIQKYIVNGKEYGFIPSFSEHQRIRNDEAGSRIPGPSEGIVTSSSLSSDESTPWKGKERKGKEHLPPTGGESAQGSIFEDANPSEQGGIPVQPVTGPKVPAEWEAEFSWFWETYGKKLDRAKCEQKFKRIPPKEWPVIRQQLPGYIASTLDVQYRKNPLTYLNGQCWNDVIQSAAQQVTNDPLSKGGFSMVY